jgi:hypothetical protein
MAASQSQLVYHDGYALDAATLFLASQMTEDLDDGTSYVAIVKNGVWKFAGFEEAVVSVACLDSVRQGFFLGATGGVLVTGLGKRVVEKLPYADELGTYLRIRNVAESLVAVGMTGQVLVRTNGKWRPIDKGIRGTDKLDLEDIGGVDLNDLYAVSAFGEMVHFDGKKWSTVHIPTNTSLSGVEVRAADRVYGCGDNGVVIEGNPAVGAWRVVSDPSFSQNFMSVETYRNSLYAAHADGIRCWNGVDWSDVDFGIEGDIDCQILHARDDFLFSIGYENVLVFDGGRWARLIPPPIP